MPTDKGNAMTRVLMVAAIAGCLGGCEAGIYLDRKDTVLLSDGSAAHANMMQHVIDPWPAHARNRDIAFNGPRMQAAVERYCQDKIKNPPSTSTTAILGSSGGALVSVNTGPTGPVAQRTRGCE
jgi:hypothetical protein